MKKQPKIPTLLGLAIIASCLVVFSLLFNYFFSDISQTQETVLPHEIQLTNIQTSSLTVTWITATPATGKIELKFPSGKKLVYFHETDKNKVPQKHIYHSVTVSNLSPNTIYEANIISNGKLYPINKNNNVVKTAPDIGVNKMQLSPAYGTILNTDNVPVSDALVLLTTEGGQLLSTITNKEGGWLIPLNTLRTNALDTYVSSDETLLQTVTAYYANDLAFAKIDSFSNAPVATLTIGKSFDFRKQIQKKQETAMLPQVVSSDKIESVLGVNSAGQIGKIYTVSITQPVDGASLVSNIPMFSGTGIPGKTITLILGITNPRTHKVIVNADGIWRFTPLEPLGIGKQSLTISTLDTSNKPIALTNTFDVLKSGTQVLGIATPSSTLAPSLSPTPSTIISVSPSPTPSPTPLFIMSPTPTQTTNEPPVSGSAFPTLVLILTSITFLSLGVLGISKL